jgi:hypothetical protein
MTAPSKPLAAMLEFGSEINRIVDSVVEKKTTDEFDWGAIAKEVLESYGVNPLQIAVEFVKRQEIIGGERRIVDGLRIVIPKTEANGLKSKIQNRIDDEYSSLIRTSQMAPQPKKTKLELVR